MATSVALAGTRRRRVRSLATRQEIIEATISCFVDIGYFRTTTTEIAKKAGVTRGAVQHYFPTTQHVLEASIDYLREQWLERFFEGATRTPVGKDYIDQAVDNTWENVNSRISIAWRELIAASRTDAELRAIIEPAAAEYEKARLEAGRRAYPDYALALRDVFERWRDTLEFLAEGMNNSAIVHDRERRIKVQLDALKKELHAVWEQHGDKVRIR
ncbi:TetR/AcrR family transcriptional regulator [Emcibacter sp. SYSU 3D8]|uniref:TetR/AcrR family transcriptional regulator n=1 Tax=Emcibacter sp. SYSU 3D8 TaxID=3133969 RepID=UPI0031FF05EA